MKWIVTAAVLLCAVEAFGFQILTPVSTPCHENLTLGAFDLKPAPFQLRHG